MMKELTNSGEGTDEVDVTGLPHRRVKPMGRVRYVSEVGVDRCTRFDFSVFGNASRQ